MSVVIDQVVGRVEPAPGAGGGQAGARGGETAPPPENPGKAVQAELRKLERRRCRLEAD